MEHCFCCTGSHREVAPLDDEPRSHTLRKSILTGASKLWKSGDIVKPIHYYHGIESILEQLSGAMPAVRLLDSQWLLERADAFEAAASDAERTKLLLPRRQDLEMDHPEAFLSLDNVLHGLEVARSDGVIAGFAIGSVSHAWARADHPDPTGSSLLRVAKEIRASQRGELRVQQPGAVSGPFGPTQYRRLPERVGIFFDWCSLHQSVKSADGATLIARSPAETAAFQRALSNMELWFAHKCLFAILLTVKPAGCSPEWVPYEKRGWPTVEHAWTMVAKTNVVACWPMIYDVSHDEHQVRRMPPLHPDRLASLLDQRTFTSPKLDQPLVTKLYRTTMLSVLGGAQVLAFPRSGWADAEFVSLAEVLPMCLVCERLELHGNACGDVGARALAEVARRGALRKLKILFLEQNQIGDSGCIALADALRDGALPMLTQLRIGGNLASNEACDELRNARIVGQGGSSGTAADRPARWRTQMSRKRWVRQRWMIQRENSKVEVLFDVRSTRQSAASACDHARREDGAATAIATAHELAPRTV